MAIPLLLLLSIFSLTPISHGAAQATPCTSYKFTGNKTFDRCADLDHLGASLHYTYNRDGTLSIAFIAAPASPNGWVSWGINPSSVGMVGAQALLAFKQTNGSMTVQTLNITSYKSVKESPILYEATDLSSVFGSDGKIVLFARLKIGKYVRRFNQVYQVGSSVTNGVPDKHAFGQDNLNAKGVLVMSTAMGPAPAPAPEPSYGKAPAAPSNSDVSAPSSSPNAAWRSGVSGGLWSILLVLLVACIVGF